MAQQLQLRRGTKAETDTFTGALGELTYVTDTQSLRIHDGVTPGGEVIGGKPDFTNMIDIPVTGQDYTWIPAPFTGYAIYARQAIAVGSYHQFILDGQPVSQNDTALANGYVIHGPLRVKKGQLIRMVQNLGGSFLFCKFAPEI